MMQDEFIARYLNSIPQQVKTHLIEVSELTKRFCIPVGLSRVGELAGIIHDVGKYSKAFQEYIISTKNKKSYERKKKKGPDHSTAGAQLLWSTLTNEYQIPPISAQIAALSIISHHGGLRDCLSVDGEDSFTKRISKDIGETYLYEVMAKIQPEIASQLENPVLKESLEQEMNIFLNKLISDKPSLEILHFYLGLAMRFLFSALVDADGLSSSGRFQEQISQPERSWDNLIQMLENHLDTFSTISSLDKLRNLISKECLNSALKPQGMYQLSVPTGGGKTLSSLRFALHHARVHGLKRIFYIVPFTTIIDQNASTVRSILEDQPSDHVILEHHSNLDQDLDTQENQRMAENWDAPIIFTTMVQFLDTFFGGRVREPRRMHNLAESVIIFDEVQTVPINTVHLFNNAANFLTKFCGSTVVFCTATQPLLDKVDTTKGAASLETEPQLVQDAENQFKELHRVKTLDIRQQGGWSDIEIIKRMRTEGEISGSVLTVVNTKKSALSLYHKIKSKDCIAFHLSTSMCPAHRMDKINNMRELLDDKTRRIPLYCVSTQLIEAGVNIDFGTVIRFLAGLDSITQAAGRCNRNNYRTSGTVLIINPADENLDYLHVIRRAKAEAERVLDEYQADPSSFDYDILGTKAMNRYYHYYFFSQRNKMSYPIYKKDIDYDSDLFSLLSTNTIAIQAYARKHNHQEPVFRLRQSFRKAGDLFEVIDAPTKGVIVPYKEGEGLITDICASVDPDKTKLLLRKAQRYAVNLFPWQVNALNERGLIKETAPGSGIQYLDGKCYDGKETGLDIETSGEIPFLNA